jgi:multidrug efflux pump subunit AcrB
MVLAATFFVMSLMGSICIACLAALVIALGLLVDDDIADEMMDRKLREGLNGLRRNIRLRPQHFQC